MGKSMLILAQSTNIETCFSELTDRFLQSVCVNVRYITFNHALRLNSCGLLRGPTL
jgi:hypothetical protein